MDLVFSRYSSPFQLIDTLIENNQLNDWIYDFVDIVNEDKIYNLWLHKGVFTSYEEFRNGINLKSSEQSESFDVNEVLESSMSVIDEIQPN